jgi:hypothetical protein
VTRLSFRKINPNMESCAGVRRVTTFRPLRDGVKMNKHRREERSSEPARPRRSNQVSPAIVQHGGHGPSPMHAGSDAARLRRSARLSHRGPHTPRFTGVARYHRVASNMASGQNPDTGSTVKLTGSASAVEFVALLSWRPKLGRAA